VRGEGDATNNIDDVEKHEAVAGLELDDVGHRLNPVHPSELERRLVSTLDMK
jgi:hypothetical protein